MEFYNIILCDLIRGNLRRGGIYSIFWLLFQLGLLKVDLHFSYEVIETDFSQTFYELDITGVYYLNRVKIAVDH